MDNTVLTHFNGPHSILLYVHEVLTHLSNSSRWAKTSWTYTMNYAVFVPRTTKMLSIQKFRHCTICAGSLVHIYQLSRFIKMDKTAWTHFNGPHGILLYVHEVLIHLSIPSRLAKTSWTYNMNYAVYIN